MTQPAQPPAPPSSAPPAPTNPAPPAGGPPAGQPPAQPAPPAQQPQQGGWTQQPQQGYPQQPGYPQAPQMQYVPVMPIPPTLAAPPTDGDGGGGGDGGQDVTKLPQWAQQRLQKLSDENAKRRVSERTAVVNQHAWVAAQQLGANAQAVLGSLAWQQASEKLDPGSPDFGRHLAEAIHRTVQQNPWMAQQSAYPPLPPAPPGAPGQPAMPAQQPPAPGTQPGQPGTAPQGGYPGQPGYPPPQPYPAYPGAPAGYPPPGYPPAPQPPAGWLRPPTSGGEFATGNTAGAPITEAQLAQMSPDQIVEAMEKGLLKHLM